jgi:N-acyl-D-aspartate/D-glutamate deacylase
MGFQSGQRWPHGGRHGEPMLVEGGGGVNVGRSPDITVADARIVEMGQSLRDGRTVVDASGLLVMP